MKTITLVTTPIGNVEDITIRALKTLKEAQFIFAEDTRQTKKLMELLEIDYSSKRIYSFNDHDQDKIASLLNSMPSDEIIIVSDAGSPVISDPAFPMIRYVLENGGNLKTVPGVSAVTTALELSGLAPLPYSFHGFLPRKQGEILTKLESLKAFGGLHLFFEGPSRILETLEIIASAYPDIQVCVAREMTKTYETVYRFKASDFKSQDITVKGEFVLCVYFEKGSVTFSNAATVNLANAYLQKKSTKMLAKLIANILDVSTDEAYSKLTE